MSTQTMTADLFTGGESEGANVRGWINFAGVLSLAVGTAAIIYSGTATIASVLVFGWLLMFAGFVQIANAFQLRYWSGFFLYLLDGIVRATVGTLLVLYPGSGAQALTLVLSFYFIAGGLFKTFGSIVLRFPSWGWTVASGAVAVILGVMLAMQWPASSTWFIGFAVGLDLILYGWALVMFAAAIKKLLPAHA
jgi:uncharacterized membrane protein HdeD (DUF308 family)